MTTKVVIVTGASKGIGAAIVDWLLGQSHKVVVTARSEAPLQALKTSHPGQVEFLAGDITDPSIAGSLVELAIKSFGQLDGLVINHSLLQINKLGGVSPEEVKRVYDVNVFSGIFLINAALDKLRNTKGSLVWVSSGAANMSIAAWGTYASSKAAVNAILAHYAVEEPDISSIAINPGIVDTDMQATIRDQGKSTMSQAEHENFVAVFEAGGLLKPEQPGSVIAKLAVEPTKELSGKFLSWDSQELLSFR
ncbi:unnamed protein product [Clonostachys byssicola]|uniref:Ketoreductase domain-containing protein n=1 Tax=Clonostachys byssicola TaxID=160290 RepID=A0A9N9UNG8_9HYPO|nr:unnamed protein product [Clonostachys byssicola]